MSYLFLCIALSLPEMADVLQNTGYCEYYTGTLNQTFIRPVIPQSLPLSKLRAPTVVAFKLIAGKKKPRWFTLVVQCYCLFFCNFGLA